MRRSGLPSAAKLSIQAAAGNSLKFSDVERAMRQQEDELMAQERQRQTSRPQRSYWVESEGQWGLFMQDFDEHELPTDDQVHWLEADRVHDLWGTPEESDFDHDSQIMYSDGFEWHWYDDDWSTQLASGEWIAYSDMKPWLDIDDVAVSDPGAAKELQELFVAFDSKVRSFKEAREAVYQKGKNRGFFKGSKPKGRGKGSTKGKKSSGSPVYSLQGSTGKGKGTNPVLKPGYTGCFICADKGHDFRHCPKRNQSSASSTSTSKPRTGMIGMVTEVEEPTSPIARSPPSDDVQRLILAASGVGSGPDRLAFAVIDAGATETVGSLDAIEYVMETRASHFGQERVDIDVKRRKRFKFGNAQEREAENYLLLPQVVNGRPTTLGVYTLDVPSVPILIGIKSLRRLGAIVDVERPALIFRKNFEGIQIPLLRGSNGHLLLDLCKDWCSESRSTPVIRSAMTLVRDEQNPDGKGSADDSQEPTSSLTVHDLPSHDNDSLSHDLHVVEVLSEANSQGSETLDVVAVSSPLLGEFSAQARLNTENTIGHSHRDHEELRKDLGPQALQGGDGSDRQVDDTRRHGEPHQEQVGSGTVRLGPSGMLQCAGSPCNGNSMWRPAHRRQVPKGQQFRDQCTWPVADVRHMSTEAGIRANMGRQRSLQECRSLELGCEDHLEGESECQPRGPQVQGNWPGSSRGIGAPATGTDPSRERQNEVSLKGTNLTVSQEPRTSHSRLGDHDGRDRGQENVEARPRPPLRGPRGEFGRELAAGDSVSPEANPHDGLDLDRENLFCTEPESFGCTALLTESTKEFLTDSLRHSSSELAEAFMACVTHDAYKCDLVEICCSPNSTLTQTILDKGGKAFRVGLENNMDLSTTHGLNRAIQFLNIVKPRWIWISPPCPPTNSLQDLNQRTEQQCKSLKQKVRKSRKIASNAVRLAEQQVERGGHVAWEWPRNNDGWSFCEVKRFWGNLDREGLLYVARLDGCQVDARTLDTRELFQKRWTIKTTSIHLQRALHIQCNGAHIHAECFGHDRAKQSAFYPVKMCQKISAIVLEHSRDETVSNDTETHASIFALEEFDLPPFSEKELKQKKEILHRLHIRAGHPTNRALHNMLRARGADPRILKLALGHECDDCKEIRLPVPHRNVSFQTSEILWHTLQMDVGQISVGSETLHVLFLIDEASRFAVAWELFRTGKTEHRNSTSEEVVSALERAWVQYHGYPNVLRCDPEGSFRGNHLSQWCSERGVALEPCPAEAHEQIGIVEATIGKIKEDVRAIVRSLPTADPFSAVTHVISAHNQMDRIGGYAPAQWAYGRLPSLDNRLFEGGNELPVHSSEGTKGSDLRANLLLRTQAEEQYRRTQAVMKINRAMKSQVRPQSVFLPGDLVYYKRFKTPLGQTTSHPGVDIPKVGLSRWYGPARVLATETRVETSPPTRKPGTVVWIIAAGRLKRCHMHQLRHCSEKERLMAEASEAITMPWSFTSLLNLVEKGQFERYDDLETDENDPQFREREGRSVVSTRQARSRSRPRVVKEVEEEQKKKDKKKQEKTQDPEPRGQGHVGRIEEDPQRVKRPGSSAPTGASEAKLPRSHVSAHSSELERHPPFQRAQERAESGAQASLSLVDIYDMATSFSVDEADDNPYVCYVAIDMPDNKKDMKKFLRDSETWVQKKIKGGSGLKWSQIPKDRIADFLRAKDKEVSNWIRESAIRLTQDKVPRDRVIRMRWLYTIKADGSAKARIILIGFEDPDLTSLQKTSPTMSRRTRGLFLTMCSLKGWTALKGDIKAAFLQGRESEASRNLYTKPVVELSRALGGNEHSMGQVLKACYGLANAPAEWYNSIALTMKEAGFEVLQSEPCAWRLMDEVDGQHVLVGVACAHVDDFLFAGASDNPVYQRAVSYIYDRYQWSPWECDSYTHCGVQINQNVDGSVTLDHSAYCQGVEQINIVGSDKDPVTASEHQQLRGALGAIQWRVYQTGPHHAARLSLLQSQLSTPTKTTLREANKLVREVYNHRHLAPRYQKIDVDNPMDVTFVAWSDAAVGNRRDWSSSGGYYIAAASPKISDGKPSVLNPISWKSGKLPRVARSSLSAEIQAFSVTEEELMFVRLEWAELCGHKIPTNDSISLIAATKGVVVTDAKSLYDIIQKGSNMTSGFGLKEKYAILDMMSLLQRLEQAGTVTRWVHSNAQLADAMTKHLTSSALLRVLTSGYWTLVDDPLFVSAKKLRRNLQETPPNVLGACESG